MKRVEKLILHIRLYLLIKLINKYRLYQKKGVENK